MTQKSKALAYALLLSAPLIAQESSSQPTEQKAPSSFELPFNAIEAGQTSTGDTRVRLMDDALLHAGPVDVLYRGFNDFNVRGQPFGLYRNSVSVGKKGSKLQGLVALTATQDGYQDTKLGARYDIAGKLGATYGYTDATWSSKEWDSWTLYGKEFKVPGAGKFTMELFNDSVKPHDAKGFGYSEAQLDKSIGHGIEAFVRAEIPNYNMRKAVYVAGVRYDANPAIKQVGHGVGRMFGRR